MVRLICLDMDGTLTEHRNFWIELHKAYGTWDEGKKLTEQYLHTDYERLIEEVVVKLWKGRDSQTYMNLASTVSYTQGIKEFFHALDALMLPGQAHERVPRAILTSGPYELAERIKNDYGIDFIFANQLVTYNGTITGEFKWPVGAGTYAKVTLIEQLCDDLNILPKDVLYIGDSMADIEPFKIVGHSIAFNDAPAELRAIATHVIESNDLRDVLPIIAQLHEPS